jgi:hypothetical protein
MREIDLYIALELYHRSKNQDDFVDLMTYTYPEDCDQELAAYTFDAFDAAFDDEDYCLSVSLIREAHKSAFAKWLGEQFDQAVFKALTRGTDR